VLLTSAIKINFKVVYVFFTQQTFSMFVPLAITWCPNLSPCGRSVTLAGAIRIYIKVVYVFTQQTFSILVSLAAAWRPNFDPCGKSVILTGAIKIHIKFVYVFLPSRHFRFSFL
jgi:hypothetical protein